MLRLYPRTLFVAILLSFQAVGFADDVEKFHEAARKGDAATVRDLLKKGVNVNAKSPYGVTALSFAADKGHVEVVKVLLENKADIETTDTFYKASPMYWAGSRGHAEIVGLLAKAGAKGTDQVLMQAVQQEKLDVAKALLANAKISQATLDTCLGLAAQGKKDLIEALKKAGAKPPPPVKEFPVDPKVLTSYAGNYRSPQDFDVLVVVKGKNLAIEYAGQTLYTMTPTDKDTFKTAGATSVTVKFNRDKDAITAMSISQMGFSQTYKRTEAKAAEASTPAVAIPEPDLKVSSPRNWPSFRGDGASGVADGQAPPTQFDAVKGTNVAWKTKIPGLGHSCPVVWGDKVFVTTAISGDPKSALRVGLYGDVDSVNDSTKHSWRVYCLDKTTGKILWERIAHEGVPQVKRHTKGTHANSTPATDGTHVVCCFGSEGLYCYDFTGKLSWKHDFGKLDSGWFYDNAYEWGFGSSPILFGNTVIVQCDVGKGSFIAAFNLEDGTQKWRTEREEIPSWATPTIAEGSKGKELVTNATKFIRGYDPANGKELWKLAKNSEIAVPTPLFSDGLIIVTAGYRPVQPIYAIKPGAKGDISLKDGKTSNDSIAWSKMKGGPYMQTPIVYHGYLYVCSDAGILACYEMKTGKQMYQERIKGRGGFTASSVAAEDRLYFTSEEGGVRVVKAGPKFQFLCTNNIGESCMATPAISDGYFFLRAQNHLFAFKRGAKLEKNVASVK